jgi:nitrous oxidase accessory protein NosD
MAQRKEIGIIAVFFMLTFLFLDVFPISQIVLANPEPTQPEPFGNIYIRADGSIDPITAQIKRSGTIYSVTSNINFQAITVQCNGITLDGNGFELSNYKGWNTAITLSNVNDVTIENFKISNFGTSIDVQKGSGIILTKNMFNGRGIRIDTIECQIENNTFIDYNPDFPYYGDIAIYGNCSNSRISENNFLNFKSSVFLQNSDDNIITENSMLDFQSVYLFKSNNNVISKNSIAGYGYGGVGIYLSYISSNNTISGNIISGKISYYYYYYIKYYTDKSIYDVRDGVGLYINRCSDNLVTDNLITNNTIGIKIDNYMQGEEPKNNLIYQNNLVNNTYHAVSFYNGNQWDNVFTGNYWSDYTSKYPNATKIGNEWSASYPITIGEYFSLTNNNNLTPYQLERISLTDYDNHPNTKAFDLSVGATTSNYPSYPSSNTYELEYLLIVVVAVVAVIIAIGIFFSRRKKKLKVKGEGTEKEI